VGGGVVRQLAAAGAQVRAASRNPERYAAPGGVEPVRLDLSRPDTFGAALDGVGSIFLYAVPDGVDRFLDAARTAGVRHVVLLSSHTLFEVAEIPERAPIAQMHEAVEDAVLASDIDWTFLRPANFASNILMWGWADSIRTEGVVRFPYPESTSDAIHEADIAAAAVTVLTEPGHAGQSYFISGPEPISQRQQAETIEAVLGRPVRIEELSPGQAREQLRRLLPEWVIEPTMAWWAATDGVDCEVTDVVEKLTGTPARTFHQWAVDHAADFR
jgi:uncharacterized protein YbjT (DUF2867 family)